MKCIPGAYAIPVAHSELCQYNEWVKGSLQVIIIFEAYEVTDSIIWKLNFSDYKEPLWLTFMAIYLVSEIDFYVGLCILSR